MNITLTKRQREILDFISRCQDEKGSPPTRTEICQAFGFKSPNAAEAHLKALANKGVISVIRGISRGIELTPLATGFLGNGDQSPSLPLVGQVAAGSPILAQENIEQNHDIDPALFSPKANYLLRVQGMSMKDAGILDGDLLAVHHSPVARNGQIVVARIEDEVTVKYFRKWGNQVTLAPANDDFKPIKVDLKTQSLDIEGLAVGVIRSIV